MMKKNIYTILIIVFLVIVAANHFWQKHQLEEAQETIRRAENLLADSIHGNILSLQIKNTIENPTREQFELLYSVWDNTEKNIGALLRLNERELDQKLEQEEHVHFCINQMGAMLYTYSNPNLNSFDKSRISDLETLLHEWEEFRRLNLEHPLNIRDHNGVRDPIHLAKTFKTFCENTAIDWP